LAFPSLPFERLFFTLINGRYFFLPVLEEAPTCPSPLFSSILRCLRRSPFSLLISPECVLSCSNVPLVLDWRRKLFVHRFSLQPGSPPHFLLFQRHYPQRAWIPHCLKQPCPNNGTKLAKRQPFFSLNGQPASPLLPTMLHPPGPHGFSHEATTDVAL